MFWLGKYKHKYKYFFFKKLMAVDVIKESHVYDRISLINSTSYGINSCSFHILKYTINVNMNNEYFFMFVYIMLTLSILLVLFSFFEKNYLLLSCATFVRLSVLQSCRPSVCMPVCPSVVCGNNFFSR